MKRRAFLLGSAFARRLAARGPRLNVYNWSDYVAPDTVPQFEREFGVRIHYGTYESNQEMLAQVMSGQLRLGRGVSLRRFHRSRCATLGLLAPLDHALLPNLSALRPEFQQPPWDPELRWAIPYMHGVDRHRVSDAACSRRRASWADLWDARLRGKLTMLDDEPEVLGACLKKLRYSLNSGDPANCRLRSERGTRAEAAAARLSQCRSARSGVAGDVLAAQAWAVTAAQAIAAAPDKLAFAFPSEGFRASPIMWRSCARAGARKLRIAGSIICCVRKWLRGS